MFPSGDLGPVGPKVPTPVRPDPVNSPHGPVPAIRHERTLSPSKEVLNNGNHEDHKGHGHR